MSSEDHENRITKLEVLVEESRNDIKCIRTKVENHLPHRISEFRKEFHKYQMKQSKWLIGILVSTVFTLIGVVISLVT